MIVYRDVKKICICGYPLIKLTKKIIENGYPQVMVRVFFIPVC